jgi:hypothetical protein
MGVKVVRDGNCSCKDLEYHMRDAILVVNEEPSSNQPGLFTTNLQSYNPAKIQNLNPKQQMS